MISTRVHGMVDYAVAALFGGLAASNAASPDVRKALAGAAAFHAGTSAMTDYEAGIRPVLTMRQHLALDAVGALALCSAGLLLKREPVPLRALLLGAGAAELAVVAFSSDAPVSGPGQGSGPVGRVLQLEGPSATTYPPLDTPKAVADGVWIVDSVLPGIAGRVFAVRMTVLRLADGGLLLHSPTRFSYRLRLELEGLGPIRHLVAPSFAHWIFLEDWQRVCPQATTWAAPGLRARRVVQRSGVHFDHDLGTTVPSLWGPGMELVQFPGGFGFNESALFHAPSRTLVLTDLILNVELAKLPTLLRPVMRWLGMAAPDGMPAPWLRALVRLRRDEAAQAAVRLLALGPERVIFAHGQWFAQDGTRALRHSLRWLLD